MFQELGGGGGGGIKLNVNLRSSSSNRKSCPSLLSPPPPSLFTGDCHLTEWSSWSSCQLTCLEGRSFETTGRQARSRAVIIQVTENQGSCPHQVFETQPCKGDEETPQASFYSQQTQIVNVFILMMRLMRTSI